jgi:hypothetical protein
MLIFRAVLRDARRADNDDAVIPGRHEMANPESMTPIRDYGFRARPTKRWAVPE